ncbi:hypothetical protein C8J56DRAFT_142221 [Mycena floridula]|nr:hypothetical protein C8J56DRAFT_142221 [Mycena floridula]
MNLHIPGPSFANSDYSDDSGHVIYRVHTPFKFSGATSSITRLIPSGSDTSFQVDGDSALDAVGHRVDNLVAGRFAHLAQIDWKLFHATHSTIRYRGEESTIREFLTKGTHTSWGLKLNSSWGLKDRVFCAPDGQKYRWVLGLYVPSLFRDDGTPIAKYYRPTLLGKHRNDKVRLEIFSEGKDMVDLIIVTFVCVEMVRLELTGELVDTRQAKSLKAETKV